MAGSSLERSVQTGERATGSLCSDCGFNPRVYGPNRSYSYCADCFNKRARLRRLKNPGCDTSYNRTWRRRNPDKRRMGRQRRKAMKRGSFIENVDPRVLLGYHEGLCGICGLMVDFRDFHIDHIIPLSRGGEHSYRNTQPAHPVCNLRKGSKVHD